MSKKSIEEYTDKELEKSIKLHESSIKKDKEIKYLNKEQMKQQIKATEIKEKFLRKLYKERERRIEKGDYSPDP